MRNYLGLDSYKSAEFRMQSGHAVAADGAVEGRLHRSRNLTRRKSVGVEMSGSIQLTELARRDRIAREKLFSEICRIIETALKKNLFDRSSAFHQQSCSIFDPQCIDRLGDACAVLQMINPA